MSSYLALYRGPSVSQATLVAVSADPAVVADFADRLLEDDPSPSRDPVLLEVERGRRRALRLIAREGKAVGDE